MKTVDEVVQNVVAVTPTGPQFTSYESVLIAVLNAYDGDKKALKKLALKLKKTAEPHAVNGIIWEMLNEDPHVAIDRALNRMEHMLRIMQDLTTQGFQGMVKVGDELFPFHIMIEDDIDDNDPTIKEEIMALQAAHRVMNELDKRTLPASCVVFFASQGFSGETHYIPPIIRQRRNMPWDRPIGDSGYVY